MTSFIVKGKWAVRVAVRFFENFSPLVRGIETLEPGQLETTRIYVDVTNDQREGVRKLLEAQAS